MRADDRMSMRPRRCRTDLGAVAMAEDERECVARNSARGNPRRESGDAPAPPRPPAFRQPPRSRTAGSAARDRRCRREEGQSRFSARAVRQGGRRERAAAVAAKSSLSADRCPARPPLRRRSRRPGRAAPDREPAPATRPRPRTSGRCRRSRRFSARRRRLSHRSGSDRARPRRHRHGRRGRSHRAGRTGWMRRSARETPSPSRGARPCPGPEARPRWDSTASCPSEGSSRRRPRRWNRGSPAGRAAPGPPARQAGDNATQVRRPSRISSTKFIANMPDGSLREPLRSAASP